MIISIFILGFLILVTYLFYPVAVIAAASFRKEIPTKTIQHPRRIFLFMAAHNEEAVIGNTLSGLTNTTFPPEQLICYVGSDASTDQTNNIVRQYRNKLNLHFTVFDDRQGKPSIINQLIEQAQQDHIINEADLFLLTDANVMLDMNFISRLSAAFEDPATGLADGVVSDPNSSSGIAGNELQYLKFETRLKHAEGILWGCAMGPFGGAYMIRPHLYKPVPATFLVDDFFIFYQIVKQGHRSRVVSDARCYESVSGNLREEFKRKQRISTGNFQNTAYYFGDMIRFWRRENVIFLLHKFLRWLSPVFLLGILVLLGLLTPGNPVAGNALLIMISLLVGLPMLNYLFNQVNLSAKWLEGISYFILMNIALLTGFINYLKGVRTNVWEPTKRSG